jgi:hypothetical protein
MSSGDAASGGGLRRYWRFPFIAGWIAAALLLKLRMDDVESAAATSLDPSTGRVVRLTQEHVSYISQREYSSLVWFGAGLALFVVCFVISAFVTGGIGGPRLRVPLGAEEVSDKARRTARLVASFGAVVCAACIGVSYSIHWFE